MADPTVVLVHGAFTDASSWSRLYDALDANGLSVKAPANPLRGIGADAEYTRSVIARIDGPVLLVGHSYGGAVITAARNADNVVGLVYVAGFAPDEGEDLGALQANAQSPPRRSRSPPRGRRGASSRDGLSSPPLTERSSPNSTASPTTGWARL